MGYGTNGLAFNTLRGANIARLPQFKTKSGKLAHSKPDGSDWSLGEWMCSLTGEVGEAANLIKKIRRGEFTLSEGRAELAKELADICVYLDLLAFRAGVDLGEAVIQKFNEVSERVGSDIWIDAEGWHRRHV